MTHWTQRKQHSGATSSEQLPASGPAHERDTHAALRGLDFESQLAALAPVTGHAPVQARSAADAQGRLSPGDVQRAAALGASGGGGPLPFADRIQSAFGHHDVGGVSAHTGERASAATEAMAASAYTSGSDVVFGGAPDLHTAAHEAAHVVQQRQGVSLAGGVGRSGDAYERHADAVADRVVRGESAEALLDGSGGGGASAAVQRDDPPKDDTQGGTDDISGVGLFNEASYENGGTQIKGSAKGFQVGQVYDLIPKAAKTRVDFKAGPVPCFIELAPGLKVTLAGGLDSGKVGGKVETVASGSVTIGCTAAGVIEFGGQGTISAKHSVSAKVDPTTGEVSFDSVLVPIEGSIGLVAKAGPAKLTQLIAKCPLGTLRIAGWSSASGTGAFDVAQDPPTDGIIGTLLSLAKALDTANTGVEVAEWVFNPAMKLAKEAVFYLGNEALEGLGLKQSEDEKLADANAQVMQAEGADRVIHDEMKPMTMRFAEEAPAAPEVETAAHKAARSMGGKINEALKTARNAASTANSTGGNPAPAARGPYGSAYSKYALAEQAANKYLAMVQANDASPQKDVHDEGALMAQAHKAIDLAREAVVFFQLGDIGQKAGVAQGAPPKAP